MRNPTSLDVGLDALEQALAFDRDSLDWPRARAWAARLACDYASVHDLAGPHGAAERARARLERLGSWHVEVTAGIADGVLLALPPGGGPEVELARSILEEQSPGAPSVGAAMRVLPTRAAPTARSPDIASMTDLRALLEDVLHQPWLQPAGGIALHAVLAGARRIELVELDNEDKVRIAGDVLQIHEPVIAGIARIPDIERRRSLATLYVLHELVHLHQGIGDKGVVTKVRSTGAETTLLHLDLAADHAAVVLANRAVPRWALADLKDLQGRSQAAYPATWMHTQASRARKALRVVSLRLDALLHASRRPPNADDGYAFVDHGPAGGFLLALSSGPPPRVLRAAALSKGDATVLAAVADEGKGDAAGIAKVDEILARALAD